MSFGNVSKYHIKNIGIDIGHTNYNSGLGKHHENIILNSRRELQIGLKTRHSQLLKQAGDLSHKPEIKEDLKAHLISTLHRGIDTTLLVSTIFIDRNLQIFISKFSYEESSCKIYFHVVIFSGHHQSFQQQPHQSGGSQFGAIQPHELANRLQRMGNQGKFNDKTC